MAKEIVTVANADERKKKRKRSINLIPNGYSWLPRNLLRLHILISRLRVWD